MTMSLRGTFLCLLCLAGSLPAGAVRVTLLDGGVIEGTSLTLTDKTLVLPCSAGDQATARQNVVSVRLGEPHSALPAGKPMLLTRGGGRLEGEGLRLQGTDVQFDSRLLGKQSRLPVGSCSALLLPGPGKTAAWVLAECRRRDYQPAGQDLLVVVREDGKWQSVAGTLVGLDEKKLTFHFRGEDRTLDRSRVRAVLLGGSSRSEAPAGVLLGRAGENVVFDELTLQDGRVELDSTELGERSIPAERVAEIRFRSDRRVSLGELKPAEVREAGLFATYPYRVDRSVSGGPIRLGGRTYSTGLGLHSRAELVYELRGQYELLSMRAGIDDAVRPGGEVELTVEADGKPIYGPALLSGSDAPKLLRLKLGGAERLTIRVGFGPDGLDVADHLDLAEAWLLRGEAGER